MFETIPNDAGLLRSAPLPASPWTTPYHQAANRARETARGSGGPASCGWPVYDEAERPSVDDWPQAVAEIAGAPVSLLSCGPAAIDKIACTAGASR